MSHQGRLFAVAYGIVKDRDEAMDVVQDTFIKAHRKLAAFEGTAAFGTWLYRICVNLCIDRKRADARHRKVDVDDAMATVDGESLYGDADLAPRISGVNPLRNASSKQLGGELGRALDLLTDDHRVILLLREVDGMSYEEISAVLHVPRGTVMSRLHHARKHMQRILRPFLGLHDDTDLEGNLIVPEVNSNRGRKKKLPSDDDSPLAATAETDLEDQSAAERPDD